jgi:hypothetical protein
LPGAVVGGPYMLKNNAMNIKQELQEIRDRLLAVHTQLEEDMQNIRSHGRNSLCACDVNILCCLHSEIDTALHDAQRDVRTCIAVINNNLRELPK